MKVYEQLEGVFEKPEQSGDKSLWDWADLGALVRRRVIQAAEQKCAVETALGSSDSDTTAATPGEDRS